MRTILWLILIYFAYYFGWKAGADGKNLIFDWHNLIDEKNYIEIKNWFSKHF